MAKQNPPEITFHGTIDVDRLRRFMLTTGWNLVKKTELKPEGKKTA